MSRPSPLEHLPRLMAEADATIAQLRTQVHDQEVANEALRNQIDVMGQEAERLRKDRAALEAERADLRERAEHYQAQRDELQSQVDRGGPSKAWREGSLTTLPQGEIRVAAEQPVRIDGVLIRGRRSKAGHAHDVLNVELVDEDEARVTVSWAGKPIESAPIRSTVGEPPGWLVSAQLREIVNSISKTLRDEPAAEWLALPRRAAHIIVALAATAKVIDAAAEREPSRPALPPGLRNACMSIDDSIRAVSLASGHHLDAIARSYRLVRADAEPDADLRARVKAKLEASRLQPLRIHLQTIDGIEYIRITGVNYCARLTDGREVYVGRPRIEPDTATIATTAATMLLELVQTLRARLAHASTELRHRAEPAPEVDDVGAACAVLAEDLDGIIAEVDSVLEAVPR